MVRAASERTATGTRGRRLGDRRTQLRPGVRDAGVQCAGVQGAGAQGAACRTTLATLQGLRQLGAMLGTV